MKKLCSRCRRNLIEVKESLCNECKAKYQAKENKTISVNESFYKTNKWTKLSKIVRNKYHNLDLYQLKVNNKIVKSKVVHHIIPVNDDISKKFDENNLIPLSVATHIFIEQVYKKGEEEKKAMQKLLFSLLENGI